MKINYTIKEELFKIGSWVLWPQEAYEDFETPGAYKIVEREVRGDDIYIHILYGGKKQSRGYSVKLCKLTNIEPNLEGIRYED